MILYLSCQDNPITFNKKNYLLRAAKRLGLYLIKDYDGSSNPEYILNIEPYEQFDILSPPSCYTSWRSFMSDLSFY